MVRDRARDRPNPGIAQKEWEEWNREAPKPSRFCDDVHPHACFILETDCQRADRHP
jgi:hypothetical protein